MNVNFSTVVMAQMLTRSVEESDSLGDSDQSKAGSSQRKQLLAVPGKTKIIFFKHINVL